jgi:putative ABC transport system permease protein
MFMGILIVISAVIIALIIYTLTMDKLRSIATLKLVGAPDRTIIGLIIQQALALGISAFGLGVALTWAFKGYFPRRVLMEPRDLVILFVIVVIMCLLASILSVRAAAKVDPASALVSG